MTLVNRILSRRITLRRVIGAAVAALLAGATASAQSAPKPKGATIDESKLDKRTRAISCLSDTVTLDGVLLRTDAVAIAASGSCKVVIKNSHIVGSAIGIQLTGDTTATIENSIVEGALALQMTGDTVVSVKSSTIRGGSQRVGGKLEDLGDNIWK